jgi:uncharacterized protein involved in response to NO
MNPIPRHKRFSGPALLSVGFRPFFLAGGIYAGLGLLIWLPLFFGDIAVPTSFSPIDWHVHEMLYGYLPAVITGFLLTAVPNWTGRLPLQGWSLAVLVIVWIAGRIAVCVSSLIGPLAAGIIDNAFLVLVVAATAREVIVGRNWHNFPPIFAVSVLLAGNVIFHVEDHAWGTAGIGTRLGVAAAVALISLVGGRVIPSFTRNWLARENPGRLPVPFGRFDKTVLILSGLALVSWIAAPEWRATAALMLIAGAAQAIRLGRWAGDRTLRDRLVLILHIGYAFVPLGFLILAAAALFPETIPMSAGIHAWTVGAIGTMTLAIMTRVTLGHTGHALRANLLTQIIYLAVGTAAVLRIIAALSPQAMVPLLYAAGAVWIAAFWMYAAGYGVFLTSPRKAGS